MNKNEAIKATLKTTEDHLKRLFLEAKWLYNHILSQHNIFEMDDKIHEVPVKVKDVFEIRDLRY